MPWESVTVEKRRKEFVMLAVQGGCNMSDLCRCFKISRKTGYKWLGRFQEGVASSLQDQPRRPLTSPRQSDASLEASVLSVRAAHPAWGGRKIAHVLMRDRQLQVAPSTVTSILHRHGKISAAASEAATAWQRFEHEQPNSLWQMDFKGHFAVGAQRCHPLTVLDDHSRYNLTLTACPNEQRTTVQSALIETFRRYGLPSRINTDNGSPWGTSLQGSLSALGVWLIRLGVSLSHSRPFHPQTNGKDERFHRSLKAEVLAYRHFEQMQQVQSEFDRWRLIYNHERPHEALSMATPVQRYRPSARRFPEILPAIEYDSDDAVRKVQSDGSISFKGHALRLSKALTGQSVALRPQPNSDGIYQIYFCHQLLNTINLRSLASD